MTRPADVLLSDGAIAVLRPLRPDDAPALHDLHGRVGDDAVRLRFFAVARGTAHQYVDHVVSAPETLTLVAEVGERLVAVASAEPVGPHRAEVAFLVDDDHRGQGLGTLLLEHLAASARDRGIRHFDAEVLTENHRMLQVLTDAGFDLHHHVDHGVDIFRMDTAVTAGVQAAADRREFAAERRSLAPLLAPRGVVVYGARRDGTGLGAATLTAVRSGGYRGRLAAVHPQATELDGVPAHRSASDVPEPPDLAVIAVPAAAAGAALEDAGAAGARAAVVISSGFGEMGEHGSDLQRQLARTARRLGIRLVGPNCLGLISNDPEISLNATFGGPAPVAGGLAVASQSGGVGIALMDLVTRYGIGLRCFVSLGNKADVSGNDLLATWYDDPAVTCGVLYLESFGNARKFARFARAFGERKPLLAVAGGRSAGGRRAGASHTAAAASPAVGVRALFAQAGVIECTDPEQLAETALLLTREPLPAGRRVAVLSNAGGLGVLAADCAADDGLDVVELSDSLQARLAGLVSNTTGTANPVDVGAGATPEQLAPIADALLGSGEVDAVVAVLVATGTTDLTAVLEHLTPLRRAHPTVPLVVVPLGGTPEAGPEAPTVLGSAAAAMGAVGRVARYGAWRRLERSAPQPSDPVDVREARAEAGRLLETAAPGGWVAPAAAAGLLGRYDVSLAGRFATGVDEAVAAAQDLGFPVAVKLAEPQVVHRTEHGLVRVGLETGVEVREALRAFEDGLEHPPTVVVQPMSSGVELALGVVRDPVLGPLVMVAAGGVATDLWDDRAFLVPPFDEAEALRVLRTLRIWPLLDGFRGAVPAASGAAAALTARLGRLALDVPEVAEIDLNPVMVGPETCTIVDAKLRLAAVDSDLELPRQLRRAR